MNLVLNVIAKPAIILMCAAVLSLLLRRASASARHAVWILALAGAILLPFVSVLVPQIELSVLPETSTSVVFLQFQEASTATARIGPAASPASANLARELWHTVSRLLQPGFVWGVGVILLSLRLIAGTVAVRRLIRTAIANRDDSWKRLVDELAHGLGIRGTVRLLFSRRQVSPMTWGLLRHTILLPFSATDWSDERRRLVLSHELAHVKRHDGLIQILVQGICNVYWFNPLAWYAAHRVRIERERACDDHVLSLGAGAADYAEHLVQIVRGMRGRQSLSFSAVSMAQPSQLEARLVSILDARAPRRAISTWCTATLCTFAGLLIVPLASVGVTAAVPLPPILSAVLKPEMPAATVPPTVKSVPKPAAKPAAAPQRTRMAGDTSPNNAVVPPKVLESKPPMYTDKALKERIEGTVTLEASVDVQGKVTVLRVVKGLDPRLDEMAKKAVLEWRFAPATSNGTPVEAVTLIEVDFKIPPELRLSLRSDTGEPVKMNPSVSPPTIIFRVEPEYTPEARDAKVQGTVVVQAVIHEDGTLDVTKVVRELDHGLTDKAIEALTQWKFKPGMKDGKVVAVSLNIEVNFNLK